MAQTFRDWELIVCDSYSNDGSWELLQTYRDPRVRLYQVPREGIFAGWNECLRRARGTYINIATSDDTCEPRLLETLLQPLESRIPGVDLSFCDFRTIDASGRQVERGVAKFKRQYFGEWLNRKALWDGKAQFLLHLVFGTVWTTMAAVLFRRDLLNKVGLFRTDMGSMADLDWSLKASIASSAIFVPGDLVTWRLHGAQSTGLRPLRPFETGAVLNSIRRIATENPGIPDHWKARPEWPKILAHRALCDYHDSFRLYRGEIKRAPLELATNCVRCGLQQPGFLFRQLMNGFAWSDDLSPVPNDLADEMLKTFCAQWPPEALPDS